MENAEDIETAGAVEQMLAEIERLRAENAAMARQIEVLSADNDALAAQGAAAEAATPSSPRSSGGRSPR